MKYDDASWHYEGDFPDDLPQSAGATHISMFLAWSILQGFAGSILTEDSPDSLERLRKREITPGQFLIEACDEKFTDEDLSDEGNSFAEFYYKSESGYGAYLDDYEGTLGQKGHSLYYVGDTWENYDRLTPVIKQRFEEWTNTA